MPSNAERFLPACPHDPIRKVGEGLYFVGGSIRMKPLVRVSRNMVVVRDGDDLTLVNPVRLKAPAERDLEAIGKVRHAIRLGPFHGRDDAYTVARFGASFWCQPDSRHYPEPKPDHELTEGGDLPIADAQLFVFRGTRQPECALLIRRGDGVLLTCDSLQHYGDKRRESPVARAIMPLLGFRHPMVVGPLWLKMMTPRGSSLQPDFERLLDLEFDTVISGHGTPLVGGAKGAVREAVGRAKF